MTTPRLILRSLVYYWRTNVGVALGVAVAAAIIVGALLVGDSVRYSLKRIALDRLGQTDHALPAGDRMVTTALADRLRETTPATEVASVLQIPGVAIRQGGADARVNGVQILGVDDAFWSMAPRPDAATPPGKDGIVLNRRLADALGAAQGDRLLLRIAKPSALPRDIPIGSEVDQTVTLRAIVTAIADAEAFGLYSLRGSQIPPYNAFVPITALQEAAGTGARANTLLAIVPADAGGGLTDGFNDAFTLDDAGGELRTVADGAAVELRSRRIFMDQPLVDAALEARPGGTPILTYFVNSLIAGDNVTPYSMVSTRDQGLADDEIEIVQWLAEDLGVQAGAALTLRYFLLEDDELVERSSTFTVKRIVPTAGPGGDRDLMPEFPGLADADSSRNWEPGIPIDTGRIRDKDEDYWDTHRGAPKAFVSLAWAQKTWGNRFGQLTQIRWPAADVDTDALARDIAGRLDPRDLGLVWQPVRVQAVSAAAGGTDFGGLFIGLSFFLVIAALLLIGLLFVFGVEQRAPQTGTLLAFGYTAKHIRRLWLGEGLTVALIGTAVGVPLGVLYTRGVLWALTTQWAGAIAQTRLWFHAEPLTLVIGAVTTLVVALGTMAWVLRKQTKQAPRALMAARYGGAVSPVGRLGTWIGAACVVMACALGGVLAATGRGAAAGGFFGAAALLLIGTILLARTWIGRLGGRVRRLTRQRLARRNTGRRCGRSLAVVALLACGCFLVVAINAFRHDPAAHPELKSSGTGGFDRFAELTVALQKDPLNPTDAEDLAIDTDRLAGAEIVRLRMRAGDDASCLNLNAPQAPPLLGVDPAQLAGRFSFAKAIDDVENPWELLSRQAAEGENVIPAMVDDAVAMWIIKKGIGDTIEYVDDHGQTVRVQIVGTLAPSIFQGYMVISEADMKRHFPSVAGYRVMLIDAPDGKADEVVDELAYALEDYGINVTDTADRLRMFTAVEHTYLTIFGVLGGLGVLLGSVGLGLVVMRNVLERRRELALMRAIGFKRRGLRWLVLTEHWALAALGLACGVIAAAVAVAPAIAAQQSAVPWATIGWTLAGVALSAALWVAVAATLAVRGRLMDALRSE